MSCCGQTPAQAQAKVAAVIDEGADAGALVRLVYVGADKRTQAFVVEGKVYQFGNNSRRRVNAVPARVAPTFLRGKWGRLFVAYDPLRHNEDGTSTARPQRGPGSPNVSSVAADTAVKPAASKAKAAK